MRTARDYVATSLIARNYERYMALGVKCPRRLVDYMVEVWTVVQIDANADYAATILN